MASSERIAAADYEDLRRYLLTVAKEGYADREKEGRWVKEPDGSTTIVHGGGAFRMHDNFFGGEPYGGREVVFRGEKPVWMMVYYGDVAPTVTDVRAVYACLQEAMSHPDEETPLRGPRGFERDGWRYEAHWDGDIARFNGTATSLASTVRKRSRWAAAPSTPPGTRADSWTNGRANRCEQRGIRPSPGAAQHAVEGGDHGSHHS